MKLNFIKSQSSVKPDLVDTTSSKTTVYVRQNIVEKEKTVENTNSEDNDATSTTVFYEYDEAKLTKEEYQEYLKELNGSDTLQTIEDLKTNDDKINSAIVSIEENNLDMSDTLNILLTEVIPDILDTLSVSK